MQHPLKLLPIRFHPLYKMVYMLYFHLCMFPVLFPETTLALTGSYLGNRKVYNNPLSGWGGCLPLGTPPAKISKSQRESDNLQGVPRETAAPLGSGVLHVFRFPNASSYFHFRIVSMIIISPFCLLCVIPGCRWLLVATGKP